jgi:hypothetical protein
MNASVKRNQTPQQKKVPVKGELICIDLPGEGFKIQGPGCFMVKDYTVLLRKHRDVVFDFSIGNGATYVIETNEDWFYDLKAGKRTQRATFKDGERFHIWVSRSFKTVLTLKSGGKHIACYPIGMMDARVYSDDPYQKPAPIIISLGKNSSGGTAVTPTAQVAQKPDALANILQADPLADFKNDLNKRAAKIPDEQVAMIVEIKDTNGGVPKTVLEFIRNGGEETAIDANNIITQNWILSQVAGAAAYAQQNKHWLREFGMKETVRLTRVVHKGGPKYYLVFTGNHKLRTFLSGNRYGLNNAKVVQITAGLGKAGAAWGAAREASSQAFRKAGSIALIFTISLDVAEWHRDYEQFDPTTGKRKKDVFDLITKVGIDIAKAGISVALGGLVMAIGASALLIFFGATLPVFAIAVGAIAIAVGVGFALDWVDKKLNITDQAGEGIRKSAEYLKSKLPADYDTYPSNFDSGYWMGA